MAMPERCQLMGKDLKQLLVIWAIAIALTVVVTAFIYFSTMPGEIS
jgi:hypothetical protein